MSRAPRSPRRAGAALLAGALLLGAAPSLAATQPAKKSDPMALPKDLPPLASERPLPVPAVDTTTLPNGLTVSLVKRAGPPLVTVRLIVRGGRSDDPASAPGLAQLLAAALKEGTARRSSEEIAALMQEAGGDLETTASADAVTVGASGLSSKLRLVLDLVADVALHPAFPEAALARVKGLALEELETNESDPFFVASRAFSRSVYGTHPYAIVSPTAGSIGAVTAAGLRQEAGRRLRPERALLLVVGDLEPSAVRPLAAELFGGWKGTGAAPAPVADAVPPPGFRTVEAFHRPGSVQTTLMVGGLGLSRRDPDAYPLDLALAIYGSAFSSRLVTNLREEKGYTYSPGAGSSWLVHRGVVRSFAAVRNEVTGAALNEILYEMERMGSTDPADEEMDRARRRNAGAQAINLQTSASVASELGRLWLLGLGPDEIGRYVGNLGKITKADVRRVSRKYLASGAARVVAVGDRDVIAGELSSFGPVVTEPAAPR